MTIRGGGRGRQKSPRTSVKRAGKYIRVAAPTRVAACNLDGVTLQSMLRVSFSGYNNRKLCELKHLVNAQKELADVDVIIFDELRMISWCTFNSTDQRLRQIRGVQTLMGGMGFLWMGDSF